jgi:hypothetical protein
MKKVKISKGDKYGMLTIIKEVGKTKETRNVKCRCECGNVCIKNINKIRSGWTKSCGCLNKKIIKERSTTHGLSGSPEYRIWRSMKERCALKKNKSFHRYGGRGIAVCKEWTDSFARFYSDMGEHPQGMTLDRIDNNGNYCKENCRWTTKLEQANNTRRNVFYKGKTLAQWSRELGGNYNLVGQRIRDYGWNIERAISTPVRRY